MVFLVDVASTPTQFIGHFVKAGVSHFEVEANILPLTGGYGCPQNVVKLCA